MTQPKIDHLEAVHDYSITQATIAGVACYRFEVRSGDVQSWDVGNIGPNGHANERAEISYAPAPGDQKHLSPYNVTDQTGKQTYDIDLYFPASWPTFDAAAHEWAVVQQFHPQDTGASAFPGFGGLAVHGNTIDIGRPDGSGNYFVQIPIVTDKWILLREIVNWTSAASGYVKILDRDSNRLLGRYDGKTIDAGQFKYLKQGCYTAAIAATRVLYETLIDIAPGDLSETAPTPAAGVDVAKATAGLQALVDTRVQLEKVTLPQIDANIASLLDRRKELQARRDQIAAALDMGDWGGGVVAK